MVQPSDPGVAATGCATNSVPAAPSLPAATPPRVPESPHGHELPPALNTPLFGRLRVAGRFGRPLVRRLARGGCSALGRCGRNRYRGGGRVIIRNRVTRRGTYGRGIVDDGSFGSVGIHLHNQTEGGCPIDIP